MTKNPVSQPPAESRDDAPLRERYPVLYSMADRWGTVKGELLSLVGEVSRLSDALDVANARAEEANQRHAAYMHSVDTENAGLRDALREARAAHQETRRIVAQSHHFTRVMQSGDDCLPCICVTCEDYRALSVPTPERETASPPINEKGEAEAKRVMNEIFGEGYMEHHEEARKNRQ